MECTADRDGSMANLIITKYCNAECTFCFAADSRHRMIRNGSREMDETEFRDCLEFSMNGGNRELRLLGGEPTLHPFFTDFVKAGREVGCPVTVFSNGVMPAASCEALAALDPEICNVVINMGANIREADKAVRRDTLQKLGPRVTLGYTITSAEFSFDGAIALIGAFGLRKNIRIGLAHPTWRGANKALHPKRYPAAGRRLLEESSRTARYGISLDADCGFVRCMFGNSFDRFTANGFRYISKCSPVLDLCTGGKILPCFALSNLPAADQETFPDAEAAYEHFAEKLTPLRTFGIYPECSKCVYFETELCCGGCIAARLRRLQPMKVR